MIFWIVLWCLVGLWFVACLFAFCDTELEVGKRFLTAFGVTVVLSIIFGLYSFIFSFGSGGSDGVGTRLSYTEKLMAIGNTSEIEGTFFLGSGTIDEKQVLKYVSKDSEGGISVETKNAESSKIYEISDGSAPRLETYTIYRKPTAFWPFETQTYGGNVFKFYIPEGSVVESFEISVTD